MHKRTVQCSTVTVQYGKLHYTTLHYGTVPYRTVQTSPGDVN